MTTPKIPKKVYKYLGNHRPSYVTDPSKVYFRAVLPLKLKDQLTGRDSSVEKTPCVGQLIEMLDCLKRTGFSDGPCRQQITAFKQCNEEYKVTELAKQKRAEEDISLVSSTKDMKREQLNLLLNKFHKKA